jgi:pyruvate kinase
VTLYRGVYPVAFEVPEGDPNQVHAAVFQRLHAMRLVATGDLVILTKGELAGIVGGTNSLQILKVPPPV